MLEVIEVSIKWACEPKFSVGSKVWSVNKGKGWGRAEEDTVLRIRATIAEQKGELVAYPELYVLNEFSLYNLDGDWPERRLFAEEKEAKRASTWIHVCLPKEIWLKSIGRVDRNNEDDAWMDLPPGCCGTTGAIRDALFIVMENSGLLQIEADELQNLLNSHEPSTEQEYIGQILNKMGLTWKEPENEGQS